MSAPSPKAPSGTAPGTPPGTALRARGIHLRHPGAERDAVRDVHLTVRAGEILCLVGPNGSGKSTTLAALGRDLKPRLGTVELRGGPGGEPENGEAGRDVWSMPRRAFARRVARLPQEPQCPEGLTVEELVRGGRNPHLGLLSSLRRRDVDAVEEALAWMDLREMRRRSVETLSGGERRRAWLAMVLCQHAEVLLLDEPTAGLDLRHQWEVLERLTRINRERGTTIVIVLHDLEQAAALAHRAAVFSRGRIYEAGKPGEVLSEEMLLDVFAVEARLSGFPAPTPGPPATGVDPARPHLPHPAQPRLAQPRLAQPRLAQPRLAQPRLEVIGPADPLRNL